MAAGTADIGWLFETQALHIAPAHTPFWYTSGLLGPYYMNTHFLCGGEKQALEVLEFIDREAEQRSSFPAKLTALLNDIAASFPIYAKTIDALSELIRRKIGAAATMISGGQRRDWFFAPLVAERLNLPCLYIYNDCTMIDGQGRTCTDVQGAAVVNVADLLTVGSSYTSKWIPALAKAHGSLTYSVNVVDRRQGGEESLRAAGVKNCLSLFAIDALFFQSALSKGHIDAAQLTLLSAYLADPFTSMRNFLISNPTFLKDALQSGDAKKAARARTLVEQDLYKMGAVS